MWLQRKYVNLASSQFRNFKRKRDDLWNLSCPFCGDSQQNKLKARGYFYTKEQDIRYSCHNCGVGMSFINFMKTLTPDLYRQYLYEKFKDNGQEYVPPVKMQPENNIGLVGQFPKLSQLLDEHEAVKYLKGRRIPTKFYSDLFFCDNMNSLKPIFPRYEERKFFVEPRIIIPIYSEGGILRAVNCRAIREKTGLRYINLKKEEDDPLIFGLNKLDQTKKAYVTEGALDSMFLPNAIAVDGADFGKAAPYINKDRDTLVYDNTPRNWELLKLIDRMAREGYRICVWPKHNTHKDINKMIQEGMTPQCIQDMIDENTYSGLTLRNRLTQWKER